MNVSTGCCRTAWKALPAARRRVDTISKSRAAGGDLMSLPRPWRQEEGRSR